MWHEARKQERMIRGMMVDYRRRAERRKDFYEKIKADPQQFLQLHGRPCKIHLDPGIAAAGDSPAIMMPWQGDTENMIDRFDVRAHLDHIADVRAPEVPPQQLSQEERHFNYERYRILAQNTFLGIGEDKFLSQLAIEEQFGVTLDEKEAQREKLNDKKTTGVAIGYNYSNPEANPVPPANTAGPEASKPQEESDEDSDLEIIDVDLSIDVSKVEPAQAHELNAVGPLYGLAGCDLFSFLTGDADDAELQKQRAREEKEKAMFSGRKSRRERRAHRDKKLATRVLSPPSYAAPNPNAPRQQSHSPSNSRSPSPAPPQAVTFITSFGGDDEDAGGNTAGGVKGKALYADKVKQNLKQAVSYSAAVRKQPKPARRSPAPQTSTYNSTTRSPVRMGPHRPGSRSPSPSSKSRSRSRSPYRSRSKSPYRSPYRGQSPYRKQSPYRNQSPYRKQSPYRNQSPYRKQSPYRSRSRSRLRYRSRSRSFSRSRSGSYSPRYRRTRSRSRSRSRSRTNRSRSRSPNQSSDYARHNSRSMSADSTRTPASAAASVPRYYGRRKSDAKSSSEVSLESDSSDADDTNDKSAVGVKPNSGQNQLRLTGSSSKSSLSRRDAGLSLKEKLKRKMQAQLSRQLRADKKAAAERRERESQLQAQRDDEMRELALRMRRRNREQRHQNDRNSSDSNSNHSSPTRESPVREGPKSRETKGSRSRSSSAEAVRTIPVWQSQADGPSTSSGGRTRPPAYEDNQDHRYDRRDRRSDPPIEEYDRGYDQSCRQEEGYSQNYYQSRQNDRYDAHRPYSNRRPYGRGHYHGRPPPSEYSEQEYDDQWEYEGMNYRGRGGRRPYGHYRGYDNRRQYQGHSRDSKGYDEYESGGRGYEGAGRGYDGARGSKGAGRGYEGAGRGYDQARGNGGTGRGHDGARGGYDGEREYEGSRTRPQPSKIRKLVDY